MTTYMHLIDTESPPPPDITEPLDATAQLPDSVKRRGKWSDPVDAGRYLQVEGLNRTLAIPIAGELVHLGRGLTADIRIDNRSVSRRHAVLVSRKTGQRILDDRSYNGTFVNGLRVEQAELRDGDVITLGCFILRFREVPEEARSMPGADTAAAIVASRRHTRLQGLPAWRPRRGSIQTLPCAVDQREVSTAANNADRQTPLTVLATLPSVLQIEA
jgi:pSer/pThr/pTyr-binding forkhead associated (FHA) protein